MSVNRWNTAGDSLRFNDLYPVPFPRSGVRAPFSAFLIPYNPRKSFKGMLGQE